MVHELIGIHNHRVDLRALTGKASKDQGEIVLSPLQDTFFEQHMFDNYGDLGQAVKGMVDTFQVRDHASSPLLSALR
jgi:vacuolar protein sorting-associated protein 45